MQIQIEERDSGRVVVLKGEVNIYHAAALRDALLKELDSQNEIRLDLDQVSEVDTTTVQILVALLRTASAQGKLAHVVVAGRVLSDVVRLCNLQDELGLVLQ